MTLEQYGERLRAYREASIEERCAMIRAYYERLNAERIARFERIHGPGSAARRQAEALSPPPGRLGGYYGVGGNLSASEYAAGGYQISGRAWG